MLPVVSVPRFREHAEYLLTRYDGAVELFVRPTAWQPDVVCVVEGRFKDVAYYVDDQRALDALLSEPQRCWGAQQRWLIIPKAKLLAD